MTPQEAWSILVKATGTIQASREVHNTIKEALETLKPQESKDESPKE